jgi:predicted MFS family arabinose efflux permease
LTPGASARPPRLDGGLMALLTVACFATAGTIHFQTPMLPEFAREFDATAAEVGWVATLSFGGFLVGTLLLAPLGDSFDKRRLMLVQLACLIGALLAMAAAPTLPALAAAALLVGICATISQHAIPLVAELAAPEMRGRVLGTVMSGLFVGILFGRLGGGFVTAHLGWRWMYVISALMLVALAPALAARLPSVPPKTRHRYGTLLASLFRLVRDRADLRRASAVQFLIGICYGGFWATLAPMLAALHGLGPAAAGLFAIPGAAGVLVARPAGRWMDRRGAGPVVTTGICLVMAGYAAFGFGMLWVAAIVVGAILQDCGLRSAMVANQALVTTADPATRSRSNTVFAIHVWGGNATGAFVATMLWAYAGWLGVCAGGLVTSALALAVYRRARG